MIRPNAATKFTHKGLLVINLNTELNLNIISGNSFIYMKLPIPAIRIDNFSFNLTLLREWLYRNLLNSIPLQELVGELCLLHFDQELYSLPTYKV